MGTFEAVFTARIAEAELARARNEPEGVVAALRPLAGNGDVAGITMFTSLGWWPTLIMATIDCGDTGAAQTQINDLEQAASERGLDLRARIAGLRARVALAKGRPAEAYARFRGGDRPTGA